MTGPAWQVLLVRHGATEWSQVGRHTGRTDLPLEQNGREAAAGLGDRLRGFHPQQVLCSPLRRARETCRLAGFGRSVRILNDLQEWDYGEYEGLTSIQIQSQRPGWSLWRDGCPGGEDPGQVEARADRVLVRLHETAADAAVFAHGHLLRVLAARWLDLAPAAGCCFALDPTTISYLGFEHGAPVIKRWNQPI